MFFAIAGQLSVQVLYLLLHVHCKSNRYIVTIEFMMSVPTNYGVNK